MNSAQPAVLVVDDEAIIRMYARQIVEDAGLVAVEASSALEALAILQSRDDIRVLFTDIEMPGALTGIQLAELVRKKWPPIGIVIASGRVKVDKSVLPQGAEFFAKPYDEKKLLETLERLASE